MSAINTGNFPKGSWEGLNAYFGAQYKDHPQEWMDLFTTYQSNKSREEDTELPGFGLAPIKAQGANVSYDTHSEGWTASYEHVVYGLGFIVTREEIDDNLYNEVGSARTRALARSMAITKNIKGANVFNFANNSSYTGGDGKEMVATDHPTLDGTQSNELATAADFSQAAVEDLLVQISKATDTRGLKMALRAVKLIYPVDIQFEVDRVCLSSLEPDSANNAINPIYGKGMKKCMNHFFTDTDAWWIGTDCPEGLKHFNRRSLEFTQDNTFDSENRKFKATERYDFGWSDWRAVYGSAGS